VNDDTSLQASEEEEPLPLEPYRPDCCNGGCAVCVLEGFDDEMALWRRACNEVLARRAAKRAAG
jgi:hypothetical protein